MTKVDEAVEAVFSLYKRHGTKDYIGEPVSQTEHMVQCAMLAESENWETQYVLAALFHDIGHLVAYDKDNVRQMVAKECADAESSLGAMEHGQLGGTYLKNLGFPQVLCEAVAGHVDAKRYLVFADSSYHDKLSPASKQTLVYQGGPMKADEAEAFRQKEFFDAVIRLRYFDDQAKVQDMKCKPLEYYEEMCRQYLLSC
ncbi:2-amino-1-hydroxyethylphosphonate dioxygenase (glycine-forming)-like [Sycon ciliatum]|uniref:2-amino-1-hydroxyethylphosphonate dioxygenase (glycine-forming)-like n=1 Tax=Sycon ciliatum TaxID=27933 RepID=UPI0020AA443B|eukprot:scpid98533/ scgid26183/ Uncharacterized protein L432